VKAYVQVSPRAEKDFRRLDGPARERMRSLLVDKLKTTSLPQNLDIKPLEGLAPWFRVRVGEYRVIFRALTAGEIRDVDATAGWYVARIVDRKDLPKAVKNL